MRIHIEGFTLEHMSTCPDPEKREHFSRCLLDYEQQLLSSTNYFFFLPVVLLFPIKIMVSNNFFLANRLRADARQHPPSLKIVRRSTD